MGRVTQVVLFILVTQFLSSASCGQQQKIRTIKTIDGNQTASIKRGSKYIMHFDTAKTVFFKTSIKGRIVFSSIKDSNISFNALSNISKISISDSYTFLIDSGTYVFSIVPDSADFNSYMPIETKLSFSTNNPIPLGEPFLNWKRETMVEKLFNFSPIYNLNDDAYEKFVSELGIDAKEIGSKKKISVVSSSDKISVTVPEETRDFIWRNILEQVSLSSNVPTDNLMLILTTGGNNSIVFQNGGNLVVKERDLNYLHATVVNKTYLEKLGINLFESDCDPQDITELCKNSGLKRPFRLDRLSSDFEEFLMQFYNENRKALLEHTKDEFQCKSIIRGLQGEVRRGSPQWEKIVITCHHASLQDRCVYSIRVNGLFCSGLAYPADRQFVNSMGSRDMNALNEYCRKLKSRFRDYLIRKYKS